MSLTHWIICLFKASFFFFTDSLGCNLATIYSTYLEYTAWHFHTCVCTCVDFYHQENANSHHHAKFFCIPLSSFPLAHSGPHQLQVTTDLLVVSTDNYISRSLCKWNHTPWVVSYRVFFIQPKCFSIHPCYSYAVSSFYYWLSSHWIDTMQSCGWTFEGF